MALLAQRIVGGLSPARFSRTRPPATETSPDRILLGPKPGHTPSDLPPVRIYLGSERHQFRAERVFLWSIEKHRDPTRTYEIYLMRDVRGFSRGFWLTGFTNYRFAIPAFCNYQGRAIYNDADQIYLTDPAKLFDLDMDGAGFLSINDRDTSVMLIDCAQMADVWTESTVRKKSRKQLEAVARQKHRWGALDGGWNARDKEFDPASSKVVHFTTLHTQPWRPFPEQLVYFENPTGRLWPDLEDEANGAKFLPFNATRPSRHWAEVNLYLTSKPQSADWLAYLSPSIPSPTDRLSVSGLFEHTPDQDVLWVLDRLFTSTSDLSIKIREPLAHGHGLFRRSAAFWLEHLQLVSQWHPTTRWHLEHASGPIGRIKHHHGGPAHKGHVVWLSHQKPGHNGQARTIATALAKRLDRTVESVDVPYSEVGFAFRWALGRPPKPELPENTAMVVAGGWLSTRLARAYQQRYPYIKIILCGRKSGPAPTHGGVIVQCAHFDLPPHPNRIVTHLPLNCAQSTREVDTSHWQAWLQASNKVACLLGGDTKSYRYSIQDINALASELNALIDDGNGHLLLVGSRRSGTLTQQLTKQIKGPVSVYDWQPNDPANPYWVALAQSDALIVTGESESMLADVVNHGKPFSIFYPEKPFQRHWDRLGDWVARRAVQPRYNRRGSIRPQQGLQYVCARLLERHWVLPPRNLGRLHRWLYDAGLASPLGKPLQAPQQSHNELDQRVDQIIAALNL